MRETGWTRERKKMTGVLYHTIGPGSDEGKDPGMEDGIGEGMP